MLNFETWAKGAIGRSEREVEAAIHEAGGATRVVVRDGRLVFGLMGATFTDGRQIGPAARANLVVANGIVTEITFG